MTTMPGKYDCLYGNVCDCVLQEEITKGLANKQPKIVTGCIQVLRTGLK